MSSLITKRTLDAMESVERDSRLLTEAAARSRIDEADTHGMPDKDRERFLKLAQEVDRGEMRNFNELSRLNREHQKRQSARDFASLFSDD